MRRRLWRGLSGPSKGFFRSVVRFLLLVGVVSALLMVAAGVLTPLFNLLNRYNLALTLGTYRLSLTEILRGVLVILLVLWAARLTHNFFEEQIDKLTRIKQENRLLYSKIFQVAIYAIFIVLTCDFLGIKFKSIAWFSGAIGIGVGFGLQKTAANFISGILLLFEKTLRNNDIVELEDGTVGFLRGTGARCTRLETFDGKEVLIPNEDLITRQVKHWTYSHKHQRVEFFVPVGLESDLELVAETILSVIADNPHCLDFPEPGCYLAEFTPNAARFFAFFWIADVSQSYWQPKHEVQMEIWRRFKRMNLSIPRAQMDVYLRPVRDN